MFLTAPVDGHWGRWSSWTSCSAQCGPGTRSRVRSCDDPMPKYGGKHCIGEKAEKKSCVFQSCGLGKTAVLGGYLSDVKLSRVLLICFDFIAFKVRMIVSSKRTRMVCVRGPKTTKMK
jgi:hypothetical protein